MSFIPLEARFLNLKISISLDTLTSLTLNLLNSFTLMSQSVFSATFNSSSPYREAITEILQLLEDSEIITPDNQQQAIAIAQDYLEDNSDFISIFWCADDVLSVADDRHLKLTKEQCLDVLDYLESNHDANIGISWDSIGFAFDSLGFD